MRNVIVSTFNAKNKNEQCVKAQKIRGKMTLPVSISGKPPTILKNCHNPAQKTCEKEEKRVNINL